MSVWKRIVTGVVSGILLLSLAACGREISDESTHSSHRNTSDTAKTDSSENEAVLVYDSSVEHKIIMDVSARGLMVVDLDLTGDHPEEWFVDDGIVWEWTTDDAKGAKMEGVSITTDSARLRYSPYYKSDVVVFCGSGGWVGIVNYKTKELLFEHKPGFGPHSAELLPNGDLVLACSGNSDSKSGRVLYYPLSAGKTEPSCEVALLSAHGVCYDPAQDVVWALGGEEIVALNVAGGGTETAKISVISGMGASLRELGHDGGHDLSPVYGQPGKYWVSSTKQIWVFDSVEGTLSASDLEAKKYTNDNVKGIAYFPDGTMIQTAHDQGGTGTYRSSQFRVLYRRISSGKVKVPQIEELMIAHSSNAQTYKVNVFTKDYQ